MMLIQSIGEAVKQRRKEMGITQATLAELSEVSQNTIYKFERGQNNPSLKVVGHLFEVLGLEILVQPKSVEL